MAQGDDGSGAWFAGEQGKLTDGFAAADFAEYFAFAVGFRERKQSARQHEIDVVTVLALVEQDAARRQVDEFGCGLDAGDQLGVVRGEVAFQNGLQQVVSVSIVPVRFRHGRAFHRWTTKVCQIVLQFAIPFQSRPAAEASHAAWRTGPYRLIVAIAAAQTHFCCNAVMPSRWSPGSALHLPIPRLRAGTATMRRAKMADVRLCEGFRMPARDGGATHSGAGVQKPPRYHTTLAERLPEPRARP